jgi:hypothetical protein
MTAAKRDLELQERVQPLLTCSSQLLQYVLHARLIWDNGFGLDPTTP